MAKEEKCLKWVGDKCVKWVVEDGKIQAQINQKACSVETMKEIKDTLGKATRFSIKFSEGEEKE